MGAGALAGFTMDFQVKSTNVTNFLGANWFDIWAKLDAEKKGFVKTGVCADFLTSIQDDFDGFFKPLMGTDGKLKQKVYVRAFKHTTLRDGGFEGTNIYDFEFRRLVRYLILMNELSMLCGESEAEEKNLTKEDFTKACRTIFEDINDETLDKAFANIDDLGGNKWKNELICFDEFCHYVFCVMDA